MGARYIIFSPFPLFVSVYVYASVGDFVCIPVLSPFVLGFCPSVFFFFLIIFFSILITLFYFILLLLFFLFFSPFYSEPCG